MIFPPLRRAIDIDSKAIRKLMFKALAEITNGRRLPSPTFRPRDPGDQPVHQPALVVPSIRPTDQLD